MSEKSNGRPAGATPNGQPLLEKVNGKSVLEWLEVHPGWSRKSNTLFKEYRLASFRDSIVFVNRIAGLADAADHHPDIDIRYRRVTLSLSTHSAGGLTAKDFDLADKIEELLGG